MGSPVVLADFLLLAVVVIFIHSSQYLAQSGLLFTTVVVARLLVAFGAGVASWMLMQVCRWMFLPSIPRGTVLNIYGLVATAVAIIMVVASSGVAISETLLEIYKMRG